MGFTLKYSDDLAAGLLRKQISELRMVLRDVEEGKPLPEHAHQKLKTVEQQIRWLRKVWFDGGS